MSTSATDDVLTRLRALVPPVSVHDGRVPVDQVTGRLPARPYVVVYGPSDGDGTHRVDDLAGRSGWVEGRVQTTVVADSAEACRIIAARVRGSLLDVVPTITGRVCFPIRHDDSQPVRRDDDVQPPVLYAVDRWLIQSTTAAP